MGYEYVQADDLKRCKTNQEALINGSKDLIWSIDTDFRLITANTAFRERIEIVTNKPLLEGDSALFKEFGEGVNERWQKYYSTALKGEILSIKEELYNTVNKRM